jgi:hypothetical protein
MISQLAPAPFDFDDVPDLDDDDRACMEATARLWASFGKLDRFVVALDHGHFDVGDDEVLIETNDPDQRTLLVRPVTLADVPTDGSVRETQWQLGLDGPVASQRCRQACFVDLKDKHIRKHHYVG